ncbi:MAG: hypothetical protein A2017_03600 [Lentisphaerae bacterium GWF2_44_16]|nr:MAG: hypothetical protein A2017_03600 [Lentisphaerae bacterium GWF2_44_16]
MPKNKKSDNAGIDILPSLLSSVYGLILGCSIYLSSCHIREISTILYKVWTENSIGYNCLFLIIPFIILTLGIGEIHKNKYMETYKGEKPGFEFQKALLPCFLLLPFFFMEFAVYTPLAFLIVWTICVFRVVAIWPGNIFLKWRGGNGINLSLIFLAVFVAIIYGVLFQEKMFSSLYLDYWDWGVFLNVIDNTLKGKWFFSNALERNFLGEHFQPGTIFLLAPYVYFFRSITAFFILNPFFLNIGAPLIYLLAVRKGISNGQALVLAFVFLLCPSIANMCPAIFYGFHMVYIVIPCILLFFLLYEMKYFKTALLIFLFSLTIKETVPVFWVGLGVVFILMGKRKSGIFIFIVSMIYYLLIAKVLMPSIPGYYGLMYRYEHFGRTYSDILLSPVTKPDVFFGSLFRYQNIYLLIMLLSPVMMAVCNFPILLLSGAITYLFICLQGSPDGTTNFVQYQAEIVSIIYICSIYGYAKIKDSQGPLYSIFLAGLKKKGGLVFPENSIRQAVLIATVCSSFSSFYFFSVECFYGKNSHPSLCFSWPDVDKEVEKLKTLIPEGSTLSATSHIAGHFVLRNDTFLARGTKPREYILMDLADLLIDNKDFENFRRRVLLSDKYNLHYYGMEKGHSWLMLKRETKKAFPDVLKRMSNEQWDLIGMPIKLENPDFKGRIICENKNKLLLLYIRLEQKVDYDVFIRVNIFEGAGDKLLHYEQMFPFGCGFRPAYTAEKGDVFTLNIPVDLEEFSGISVRLDKRPEPDPGLAPF